MAAWAVSSQDTTGGRDRSSWESKEISAGAMRRGTERGVEIVAAEIAAAEVAAAEAVAAEAVAAEVPEAEAPEAEVPEAEAVVARLRRPLHADPTLITCDGTATSSARPASHRIDG